MDKILITGILGSGGHISQNIYLIIIRKNFLFGIGRSQFGFSKK